MIFKAILIFCLIVFTSLKSSEKVNLFKEISITSQKAVCKKDKHNKSIIDFTYINDVLINFSDGSLAKAEKLSVKINIASKNKSSETVRQNPSTHLASSALPLFAEAATGHCRANNENNKINDLNNNSKKSQNLKQIVLDKNVFIKRENRNIKADKAEFFPSTETCKLSGNVRIEQTKKDNDFPIITKCENAHLDLITEKITLVGNKKKPVSTIINLDGYSGLGKKKKAPINKNV